MQTGRMRRALALRGLTPATLVPEPSGGREEEATIRPARLLEGEQLAWLPVGAPAPSPDPLAFLDGIQRSEVIGYAGSAPIVVAEIAAAVRERTGRRLQTVLSLRAELAIARPAALEAAGDALEPLELIPLPDDEPPHPSRDLLNARRALDRARGALEITVGDSYRRDSDAWLIVDGALSDSPGWAADHRMIGVAKSHATLPFGGLDLERYLRLPAGHRSSIYAPETRSLAPVCAWALRLWPWENRDVFYGLVRVEVAPANGTPESANAVSRWLLGERAPVSAPDPRWDRLLYGIRAVEQYLRSGPDLAFGPSNLPRPERRDA